MTQIFNGLKIEASKSAEVSVFSRFRKHFDSVCQTSKEKLTIFDSSVYSDEAKALMEAWRSDALMLLPVSTQHQHADYKEFSELCLLYLDGLDYTDFSLK